jgi:rubredoxin
LFVGKIVDAQTLSDKPQMTYAFYHMVKKGITPKSAPTYSEKEKKQVPVIDKYVCSVCGYVYDPIVGDADSGVKQGTSFEDLPDGWVCPICGASKDHFEKQKN